MVTSVNEFDNVWAPPNRAVDGNNAVYDSIQDAVDAGTGLVLIGPSPGGQFNESVVIDDTAALKGTTIVGVGEATVVDGGSTGPAFDVRADEVTLERLAARTDRTSSHDAIKFDSSDGMSDPRVRAVTVLEAGSDGIYVRNNTTGGYINNCIVERAGVVGIRARGKVLNVQGCVVGDGNDDDIGTDGIVTGGGDTSVDGCVINNVGDEGISAGGPDELISNNIVVDADTSYALKGTDQTLADNVSVTPATDDVDTSSATNPEVRNTPVGNDNNVVSDESQLRVDLVVDSPEVISNAVLANGESAELSVPVPDGETMKVYRWGAYKISDGSTPTDLDVELKDGSDTVQATANTTNNESTDPASPVVSHTNSTGSLSIYKLAVANDTGSEISDPGVGAMFGYIVE